MNTLQFSTTLTDVIDGDRDAAAERVARDLVQHLNSRAVRHGAGDAEVVALGTIIGAARYLSGTRGDVSVVQLLGLLLDEAQARIERKTAPADKVIQ